MLQSADTLSVTADMMRDRLVAPGTTGAKLINLLNGIAWMGEVSKDQIQRIWYPTYSERTVRRALHALCTERQLLARHWWYRRKGTLPPEREGALYTLTPRAQQIVSDHAMFPLKPRGPGQPRLRNHDQMTNTVLSYLIEAGRAAGLSGVFVYYEYRLNPHQPRPRVDALMVLRVQAGAYPHPDMVPWTRYAGTRGEGRSIRLAVETDRDSEPPSVLKGKGLSYAACARSDWIDRHGHFPTPTWIVPHEARLHQLWQLWCDAWPQGFWRITTDDWLKEDCWNEYFQGETFTREAGTAVGMFTPLASYRPGTAAYARRVQHGRLDFGPRQS